MKIPIYFCTLFLFMPFSGFGQLRSVLEQEWDVEKEAWVNLKDSLFYYDSERRLSLFSTHVWNLEFSNWEITQEDHYDYIFIGDKKTTFRRSLDLETGSLSPTSRAIESFDFKGRLVNRERYIYDDALNQWKLNKYLNRSYNDQDCLTNLTVENLYSSYVDSRRYDYFTNELCEIDSVQFYSRFDVTEPWDLQYRKWYIDNGDTTFLYFTWVNGLGEPEGDPIESFAVYDNLGNVLVDFVGWTDFGHATLTQNQYDNFGNLIFSTYQLKNQDDPDALWNTYSEREYSYLNNKVTKLIRRDSYSEFSEAWNIISTTTYKYDNQDRVQEIHIYSGEDIDNKLPHTEKYFEYFCNDRLSLMTWYRRSGGVGALIPDERTYYTYWDATNCGEEFDQENLIVFPNPAEGVFTIHHPALESGQCQLFIYDSKGVLVQRQEVDYKTVKLEVFLPSLSKGIYFVRLIYAGSSYTAKLFVE